MSNESFRLESFRPWNPHEKPRSWQGPLDLRRYPSPVSLNATPSPNNSKDLAIHSQMPHVPKLERHPLPVRPPIEVCVDETSQSVDQNVRKPALEGPISPVNQDSDNLGFEEILHLENLPSPGHIDDMIFNSVDEQFEQGTRIASCNLEPSFTSDQVSQSAFQISTSPGMEDSASDLAIDPAMLEDHHCRDGEQQDTTEIAPTCTTHQEEFRADNLPSAENDGRCRGRRCRTRKENDYGRRSSKIQKVSVVIDSHQMGKRRKSTRKPGHQEASLSTILVQFSALRAEDRLQFLSWLFEGALSRCLPGPGEANTKKPRTLPSDDVSPSRTESASADSCPSRKRSRYSTEENRLLIQLKGEGLAWREVIARFDESFPGRSPEAIKVHWSTKLSKQRSSGA